MLRPIGVVNLNSLPYFDKVLSLFSKLADGWKLFTTLEFNGKPVLHNEGFNGDVSSTNSFLNYINQDIMSSNSLKNQNDINIKKFNLSEYIKTYDLILANDIC